MAEYIKRDDVIQAIERYSLGNGSALGHHSGAVDCAIQTIENMPAADVVPVRHGKWLLYFTWVGHYWECSECHTNPFIYVTKDTKFCPKCGAKMDLKEESHDTEAE